MPFPEFLYPSLDADIRRQMDGVLALVEQLRRHRLPAEALSCVDGVAEAASAVTRVLAAAHDLGALAEEGLTFEVEAAPLRDLVDDVSQRWRGLAEGAGMTLLVSYDGPPHAVVMADRARLLQVFDGLLGEALAGARRSAVEVGLCVAETPEGLRLEGKVRSLRAAGQSAQDPETRLREVESRFGFEAALGLALAHQVIAAMGGAAQESWEGAARTLTFTLLLPAAQAEVEAPATVVAGRQPHVLVVDDNATNRMVAQALCEMFDCTSESAEDGLDAVEAARGGRFDLILMDIKMPRMDGVDATRAIRAMAGPAGLVPIIALTANADPEDARGYLAVGMNGVVEKPMKPEQLLETLQRALAAGPATPAAAAAAA